MDTYIYMWFSSYLKLFNANCQSFHNTIGQGDLTNEGGSCYCNETMIIDSCLNGKKMYMWLRMKFHINRHTMGTRHSWIHCHYRMVIGPIFVHTQNKEVKKRKKRMSMFVHQRECEPFSLYPNQPLWTKITDLEVSYVWK